MSEPSVLPCIVCGAQLQPVFPGIICEGGYVQPSGANTCTTSGTYGSEVFDPCDGSSLDVNVCDVCLTQALATGSARITARS